MRQCNTEEEEFFIFPFCDLLMGITASAWAPLKSMSLVGTGSYMPYVDEIPEEAGILTGARVILVIWEKKAQMFVAVEACTRPWESG